MADPFAALRSPIEPIDPDPAFAARLRARIERALAAPQGVPVTATATATRTEPTAAAQIGALTPYLCVADARRALAWYSDVFGARLREEPYIMPDNRVGHAELEVSGAVLMLAEEFPEIGVTAPVPGAGSSVSLRLEVQDLDAVVERSARAGATVERPPTDSPYGRGATIRDPFGHRWLLAAAAVPTAQRFPNGSREGDVGYISLEVPDLQRAMDFYGAALGWRFSPGSAEQGRQVDDVAPMIGLSGGQPRGLPVVCWRVDDMNAAIERVRAAGGTADEPTTSAYGTNANCVDDQGMRFYLWQPTAEQAAAEQQSDGRNVNGSRQGDVAYLTFEVRDSARAQAFYGAVLGWRFTPGRVDDGWNIEGTMPMAGMQGGHAQATVIPMYLVEDIDAAVERIREAGGSSNEPHQEPYGKTAECTDDQGTRFYLGQL